MGVSTEWVWSVALCLIGFLASFQFYQITENIKEIWRKLEKYAERLNECDGRHDLSEERARHLAERVASLEAKYRQ